MRLGFIGAPIATMISFYLVSLVSLLFGIYYMPRKGWHPITSQMFTNLGVVTRLGISGIGRVQLRYLGCRYRVPDGGALYLIDRSSGISVVGVGAGSVGCVIVSAVCLVIPRFSNGFSPIQTRSDRAGKPVYPPHVDIHHLASGIQSCGGHYNSVSLDLRYRERVLMRS